MIGNSRARPPLFAAGVLAGLLALAGVQQANAQSVYFSGYTQGCFGLGCTPAGGVSTNQALNYSPSSGFNVTTVNGFGSIGGPINNFGRFSLGTFGSYTGQAFTLLITFIDPAANNNVFAASLTGSVRSTTSGGVFIDFDNTKQFWGDGTSIKYSVMVNDLSVHPGENLAVSGNVTATPEPISMLLVGTGLAGLGVARRRRTRLEKADLI